MKDRPNITVCASGNIGRSIAADCSLMGYPVKLYELKEFEENIKYIQSAGGIEISGVTQSGKTGFAPLDLTTSDPELAFQGSEIIMLAAPAMGHIPFFDSFYKYLEDGQCILVNTGYWGSLRIYQRMKELGINTKLILAESALPPYLSLEEQPNLVHCFSIQPKESIPVATFPGDKIEEVFERLKEIYPQLYKASNIIATNLDVGNPSIHPPFTVPIAGLVFDKCDSCKYYREVTSSGAKIAHAFDKERIKLSDKLGIKTETIESWAQSMFGSNEARIEDKLKKSVFAEFDFPSWALKRTLDEDIEYNYVPFAGLAEAIGVEVPHVKAMVTLFGTIFGKNYWETGVTLKKLGLQDLTKDDIIEFLKNGNF